MKQIKYSRQRELILQTVQHACNHPTADWVYQQVRASCPNISLATVYRNLNQLAQAGQIKKIPAGNGGDRFDRTTGRHYHMRCTCCGNIFDVNIPFFDQLNALASKQSGFDILSHDILFVGLCDTCKKLQNEKGERNHGIERVEDRTELDDSFCRRVAGEK